MKRSLRLPNLTTGGCREVLSAIIIIKTDNPRLQLQGLDIFRAAQIPQFDEVIVGSSRKIVPVFGKLDS